MLSIILCRGKRVGDIVRNSYMKLSVHPCKFTRSKLAVVTSFCDPDVSRRALCRRAVPTLTAELPTHPSQRCTSPGIVCDLFDEAGLTSGTRVLLGGGGGGGGWAELWVWDISRAHCCLRDRARPTAGQWEHRATGGHSPAMQHGPGGCHKGGLSYSEGGGCHMVGVGVS